MKNTIKYHLPPILYGVVILAVSSIPNLKAPEVGTWPIDKVAHLVEYAGFAILVHRSSVRWRDWLKPESTLWLTLLITATWGILDELWQAQVPGRFSDPWDLLVDVAGAALVVGIVWFRRRGQAPEPS